MTVNIRTTEEHVTAEPLNILELYRTMVTARVMNDLLKVRKTQGRFPFYIGCAGHESMAAVVAALQPEDWLALYYRDLAAWLQRTHDLHGPLREAYSRTTGPMGAGRNMPAHYSSKEHHILPTFSEVGALASFAGGVGFSLQRHQSKQIILFTTGDGGVATNDFSVLFRQASVHQIPVLIVVEDNGWAITTTNTHQWGGSLVEWARGGGLHAEEVDGTNPLAVYEATRHLAEHVRSGQGPVLMHLRMGLLDPHSSSTDIRTYRPKEEIEATVAAKDPVKNFGRWLVEHEYLKEQDIERIRKEIKGHLERIEAEVIKEPEPTPERVMEFLLDVPEWQESTPRATKRQLPMLGAINEALVELAQRDEGFFVYGQDVGSPKGGVFGATSMLVNQFPERAISSPLNEQLIVGTVAGAGMIDGKARCAEIQFVDYHQSATQTIRLAARVLYQTLGSWTVPMIIRTKSGSGGGGPISSGGAGGGAFGHSNSGENWFTTIPGMITICPSTPFDAKGLLLEAARAQSPVTFLERGRLYRSEPPRDNQGNLVAAMAEYWYVPEGYYTQPIGKARRMLLGEGPSQMAIITWGTMVLEACTAATNYLNAHGGAIEVVDLRTLVPFDQAAIIAAIQAANHVLVVTEESDLTSFGRHLHSWISQNCFYELDATPGLLAALPAPSAPYNAPEEGAFFPTAQTIERKISEILQE